MNYCVNKSEENNFLFHWTLKVQAP